MREIVICVQAQIVAHVLEAVQVLETQCGDERQLHIENAILIIGRQHKIAVGVTDRLSDITRNR